MVRAECPVGFFDSGVGGLCILRAFQAECPNESTVYIADSGNCPYGNRPSGEIIRISKVNARRLIAHYRCKMVVVACNTATAAAIETLRRTWQDIPFVGIEPALKPAALRSKSGVVGVLATAGTFGGRLYNETKAKFARDVTVLATVADEWVTEVERLKGVSPEEIGGREQSRLEAMVRRRVEPLIAAGADKIVLGCTHFPHLKPIIEKVVEGRAEVIDPSAAVAVQARRVLERLGVCNVSGAVPVQVMEDRGKESIFRKSSNASRKI